MLYFILVKSIKKEKSGMKYKTNIEITSEASNKDEAMEIVEDYLSGNIVSGIRMKCVSKPVRFYNHSAVKAAIVVLFVTLGFLSGTKARPQHGFTSPTCQMAAVQPPLKTSDSGKSELAFKKGWEEKQAREALDYIKK
jgi:hypothetical protein